MSLEPPTNALGDEEVRGGYSIGAMTDPAMRGRRLFYRLGSALYERLEDDGFAFVAGFSNAADLLLTGRNLPTALDFEPAAAACLERDEDGVWSLAWFVAPSLL